MLFSYWYEYYIELFDNEEDCIGHDRRIEAIRS